LPGSADYANQSAPFAKFAQSAFRVFMLPQLPSVSA
jgi:hypothetical protein